MGSSTLENEFIKEGLNLHLIRLVCLSAGSCKESEAGLKDLFFVQHSGTEDNQGLRYELKELLQYQRQQ